MPQLFTWRHFDKQYKEALAALLKPAPAVGAISMPEAWTCIKDVLASDYVESGVSGQTYWAITQEDTTRGLLQAQLSFNQALGSPANPTIFRRQITLNAKLAPEAERTRVEFEYQIFSPNGTGFVESVIKKNQQSLKEQLQMIRTMQPS